MGRAYSPSSKNIIKFFTLIFDIIFNAAFFILYNSYLIYAYSTALIQPLRYECYVSILSST